MPGTSPIDPGLFAAAAAAFIASALLVALRRPGWVVRFPRCVLGLLLVVSLAAGAALMRLDPPGLRLSIDPSTEPLLPAHDPAVDTYRDAVVAFGDDEIFVVAMQTEGDVFTHENLMALRRASDRISRLDGVRHVQSLVDVTSFRYVPESEWIEVRPFIEDVPEDSEALASLRSRALADPVYRQTLVSSDGRTAALNVSFREMTDGEFIASQLDRRIRDILRDEEGAGRHFFVSGRPHIKARMYDAMTRDLRVLIPVALAVVAVVLSLVSGTRRGVILPLANVATAVLWTFGAIALLEFPLTVLTVLLAPTLVAVGSVYGVHVVNRYEEEVAETGDGVSAARRALEAMLVPVTIAGLTTMIGFGALLITDVPAVFEVGAFSVLGVASVTLTSLTGVPAALALLPLAHAPSRRGPRRALAARLGALLERGLEGLAGVSRRAPVWVIVFWALLSAASAAAIPRIVVDTDYLSFFDAQDPVRREFETINRLLAGAIPFYVVFEGDGAGYLREPEVLRSLWRAQQRIDEIPGVSRTLSFLDTMRVLNRALSRDDPAEERIPDTRGAVTELFFLFPKGDLQRFATVNQSRANLVVRTGEVGSASVRRLRARIDRALGEVALPVGLEYRVTGNAILLTRAADGVARSQPRMVALAALTIFVLLSVGLRSLRLGLVAMVPNVVPVVIFFGVLGLGAAPLSLPTSLIACVSIGIAIDATAHFLVRYRAERRAGRGPEQAARRCGLRVGRPVAITSAMLILGFLSVAFSEFATLRQFGYLSALTMAVCMLTDLMLLPAILVRARL